MIFFLFLFFFSSKSAEFWKVYHEFRQQHLRRNSSQAHQRLDELLYAWGNATATGVVNKRRRWDFSGSFHFVGTIVSTIGTPVLDASPSSRQQECERGYGEWCRGGSLHPTPPVHAKVRWLGMRPRRES